MPRSGPTGITGYGGTTTLGNGGPNRTTHLTQTANASVSRLMGSHTLKIGAEYRRIGVDTRSYSTSAGNYTFTQAYTAPIPTASGGDAFASFLLGYPATGSIVYGNTQAQSESTFLKIQNLLKAQGLGMGDIVMMRVYMTSDPAMEGKLDFAGMNAAYAKFFGTPEQPNKPARSTVQVAALVAAGAFVEIEVQAARNK